MQFTSIRTINIYVYNFSSRIFGIFKWFYEYCLLILFVIVILRLWLYCRWKEPNKSVGLSFENTFRYFTAADLRTLRICYAFFTSRIPFLSEHQSSQRRLRENENFNTFYCPIVISRISITVKNTQAIDPNASIFEMLFTCRSRFMFTMSDPSDEWCDCVWPSVSKLYSLCANASTADRFQSSLCIAIKPRFFIYTLKTIKNYCRNCHNSTIFLKRGVQSAFDFV